MTGDDRPNCGGVGKMSLFFFGHRFLSPVTKPKIDDIFLVIDDRFLVIDLGLVIDDRFLVIEWAEISKMSPVTFLSYFRGGG